MREWINLVESGEGAQPRYFYHGTNPVAAAHIVASGLLEAQEPVDDDGFGPVVCVTSDAEMGVNFAHKFSRHASRFDCGFVFVLDAAKVMARHDAIPHEAETASMPEYEYRITDDITLNHFLVGIKAAGDVSILHNEHYLMELYEDDAEVQYYFRDYPEFDAAMAKLLQMAE